MDDGFTYGSLTRNHTQPPKPSRNNITKPKAFSFTQSVNQRENIIPDDRLRFPENFNTNAITTGLLLATGGDPSQSAKPRPPIFPALHRLQKSQKQQTPQKPQSSPFLSLLKTSSPMSVSKPANSDDIFNTRSRLHFLDSSPHGDHTNSDLPLSPSPQPKNAHTAQLQIFPTRSPSVPPIARSASGSRVRAHSSASLRQDQNVSNLDRSADLSTPSKSNGLPDIAINALRELQVVSDELAEERRRKMSILDQFNALSTAYESRISDHSMHQQEANSTRQELDVAKQELESLRKALTVAEGDKEKKQQELNEISAQLENVWTELKEEKEDRKRKMSSIRERMAELSTNYTTLQTSFGSLKISYDTSQALLSEVRHARGWASDGLRDLEPLLDSDKNYTRAGEVKVLVGELQDELIASQRVNDLLRDKLHDHSSQLAETRDRIRELEGAKKGRLSEIIAILSGTSSAEAGEPTGGGLAEKIQTLVKKLAEHEHQTVKGQANAAASELRCEILMRQLEEVKQRLAERVKEVEDLSGVRDANRALETQIRGLEAVQQVMQQTTGKLKIANNDLRARDKEMLIRQSEIMELKAEKAELQAFLSEAQDAAKLAGEATRRAEEKYFEESRKLSAMEGKCEFLHTQLANLKIECEKATRASRQGDLFEAELRQLKKDTAARDNMLRLAEDRTLLLQTQFDTQAAALRAAETHSEHLQDRLLVSENLFADKLASASGKYEMELAVLQECNTNLVRTMDGLKQDCALKEAALLAAPAEFKTEMDRQEAASERLVKSVVKRAEAAEQEAAGVRREAEGERRISEELRKRIEVLQSERRQVEEAGRKVVADAEGAKNEQMVMMKKTMAELERINQDLVANAKTLRERYETNVLTDEEKDFVAWLLKLSHSLHEQEDVAKDNDLRRRENLNNTLQARIHELESALARLLHNKDKDTDGLPKSIVDLRMWMSSPIGPDHLSNLATSDASTETPQASRVFPSLAVSAVASSGAIDPTLLAGPAHVSTSVSPADVTFSLSRTSNKQNLKSKVASANETQVQATISRATQQTLPFSVLGASDPESESELSDLPKRAIYVSPMKVEKPRVTRRLRAAARTAADIEPQSSSPLLRMPMQTKATEGATKAKHKKQKV